MVAERRVQVSAPPLATKLEAVRFYLSVHSFFSGVKHT